MKQLTKLSDCVKCGDCCYYHRKYLGLSTIFDKDRLAKKFIADNGEFLEDKGKFFQARCRRKKSRNYFFCDFKDGNLCSLKEKRPFGCKLYPFNIMKDRKGKISLGIDRDCLGVKNRTEKQIFDYVKYLKPMLRRIIKTRKHCVEEFQPELEIIDYL